MLGIEPLPARPLCILASHETSKSPPSDVASQNPSTQQANTGPRPLKCAHRILCAESPQGHRVPPLVSLHAFRKHPDTRGQTVHGLPSEGPVRARHASPLPALYMAPTSASPTFSAPPRRPVPVTSSLTSGPHPPSSTSAARRTAGRRGPRYLLPSLRHTPPRRPPPIRPGRARSTSPRRSPLPPLPRVSGPTLLLAAPGREA